MKQTGGADRRSFWLKEDSVLFVNPGPSEMNVCVSMEAI